jgi:hypothetical protein
MVSASSFESFEAAAAASAVDKSSNNDETRNSHCHNEGEPQYPITASEEANNNALESSKKRKRRPTASLLKKAMEELDNIWINVDKDGNHHDDETNCNTNNNNNYREAQLALGHALPPSEMDRVRKTTALLVNVLTQDIHEPAIRALVANEELKSTQLKLKSELEMSQKEVERLRRSEQRSKEAIKVCGSENVLWLVARVVIVLCVERCFFLRFDSHVFSSHIFFFFFAESLEGRRGIGGAHKGRLPDQTGRGQDAGRSLARNFRTRCRPQGLDGGPAASRAPLERRRQPQDRKDQAPARQAPPRAGGPVGAGARGRIVVVAAE